MQQGTFASHLSDDWFFHSWFFLGARRGMDVAPPKAYQMSAIITVDYL